QSINPIYFIHNMKKFFSLLSRKSYPNLALFLLRVSLGWFMVYGHGWPKWNRLFETPDQFMDFMGLGPEISLALVVFAELICSLLIILGLTTRLAALPLMFTMLVATLDVHAADGFAEQEKGWMY